MFTISDCAISVDTWSMNAFLAPVVGHVFLVSSDAVVATTSAPDPAATPDPGTSRALSQVPPLVLLRLVVVRCAQTRSGPVPLSHVQEIHPGLELLPHQVITWIPAMIASALALIVVASSLRWFCFLHWQMLFRAEVHFGHAFLPNFLLQSH
jgi:hypothetical protein